MSALIRVSEVPIFATAAAAEWWCMWRLAQHPSRIRTVTATLAGEVVDVVCDDLEHQSELVDLLISRGVPRSAIAARGEMEL